MFSSSCWTRAANATDEQSPKVEQLGSDVNDWISAPSSLITTSQLTGTSLVSMSTRSFPPLQRVQVYSETNVLYLSLSSLLLVVEKSSSVAIKRDTIVDMTLNDLSRKVKVIQFGTNQFLTYIFL